MLNPENGLWMKQKQRQLKRRQQKSATDAEYKAETEICPGITDNPDGM